VFKIIFDVYTPSGQGALACIDTVSHTIYISDVYLGKMSLEEIRKTIAHEITHEYKLEHTPEFYKRLNEILSATWKPRFTSGIVMVDGSATRETKPIIQKEEINLNIGSYL
jgi:hypothetical protein